MLWRKWLLRSLILILPLLVVTGGVWLAGWIDPETVRQKVIEHLHEKWDGVDIEVSEAHLRLFGGISVTDVRLIRQDDPTRTPFLHIPSAILFHDKEQLTKGRLVLRKIELERPHLRVERDLEGKWIWQDLLRPSSTTTRFPCIVIHKGSASYVDHRITSIPLLEIGDIEFRALNDPLPVHDLQARLGSTPLGPLTFQAKYNSEKSLWNGSLDCTALVLGSGLSPLLSWVAPAVVEYLQSIEAVGTAHLDWAYQEGPQPILAHDLRVELRQGRIQHRELPMPLEDLQVNVQCRNGHLILERANARAGNATVNLRMELPPGMIFDPSHGMQFTAIPDHRSPPDPIKAFESRVKFLELTVNQLPLTPKLFQQLPKKLRFIDEMFAPEGPVSVVFRYQQENGIKQKRCVIRPEGFSAVYDGFRYPLRNVRGTIDQIMSEGKADQLKIDVTAEANGRPVSIVGEVIGEPPESTVDLTIRSSGLSLSDPQLIAALPLPYPALIRRLNPGGQIDLLGRIQHNSQIRREYGRDQFKNEFLLTLRNAVLNYEEFPYPLAQVNGELFICTQPPNPTQLPPTPGVPTPIWTAAPDVGLIEIRNITANHNGALLTFNGRKEPTTGGAILTLNINGQSVAFDEDLRFALSQLRIENVWKSFSPRGVMNCAIRAKVFERGSPVQGGPQPPFNPNEDLELNMAFAGGDLLPSFFPYLLSDIAGRLAFAQGRVELRDFSARHNAIEVKLPFAEVLFRPGGGYWADLQKINVTPLLVDADFLRALPPGIRNAFEGLEMRGPVQLYSHRIVIDDPISNAPPPYLPLSTGPIRQTGFHSSPFTLASSQNRFNQRFPAIPNAAILASYSIPPNAPPVMPMTTNPKSKTSPMPNPHSASLSTPGSIPMSTPDSKANPNGPAASTPSPMVNSPMGLVVYWDSRLVFDGASFKTGVPWEGVHGVLASRGRYEGDRFGECYANLVVEKARILKQPMEKIYTRLEIDPRQPNAVRIPVIKGQLFGGEIGGEARLLLQNPLRYDLKLNATRIRLDEIAKQQKLDPRIHLEGLANAQIYVQNPLDEQTGRYILQGAGSLDIPQGKMLRLPGILDLLKVLKLKVPDETFFEEAHALFRIRDQRVMIGQLDLLGDAISLGGEGEMNLDGTDLNLQFYTVWSRINNLMAPIFSDVTSSISKAFFKVVVTGDLDKDPKIRKEPVPIVVEPIKRIMDRRPR